MRIFFIVTFLALTLYGCDESRVYEKNRDFENRSWLVNDSAEFEFEIRDTISRYNLYCNVRNSLNYPYSRLFITYSLLDSSGQEFQKKLAEAFLFDRTTGKPFGSSGLGDIYDQRIPLLTKFQFPHSGKYKVRFEQEMRKDTIEGILAVGLRVERAGNELEQRSK